jgi:hypothetical protein
VVRLRSEIPEQHWSSKVLDEARYSAVNEISSWAGNDYHFFAGGVAMERRGPFPEDTKQEGWKQNTIL